MAKEKAAEILASAQAKSRDMRRADEGLTANLGEIRKTRAALKQQVPPVKE